MKEVVDKFIEEVLTSVDRKDPETIQAVSELLNAYQAICEWL